MLLFYILFNFSLSNVKYILAYKRCHPVGREGQQDTRFNYSEGGESRVDKLKGLLTDCSRLYDKKQKPSMLLIWNRFHGTD